MSRLTAVLPVLLFLLAQPRLMLALVIVVTAGTALAVRWLLRHRTVLSVRTRPGWSYA